MTAFDVFNSVLLFFFEFYGVQWLLKVLGPAAILLRRFLELRTFALFMDP